MDAIRLASYDSARKILIALCNDAEVCGKAIKYLYQLEPQAFVKAREAAKAREIAKANEMARAREIANARAIAKANEAAKARQLAVAREAVKAREAAMAREHAKARGNANRVQVPNPFANPPRAPTKRKAVSALAICVQCDSCFNEADNYANNVCRYHDGRMECDWDSDYWADYDDDAGGPRDSEYSRKEYPDGWAWTCCDEQGSHRGCKLSRHESAPERNKRRMM